MRRAVKVDETNPNFKNAGWHKCAQCGEEFHSYHKTRKFCSQRCAGLSPANLAKAAAAAKLPRPRVKKLGRKCVCKFCGIEFRSPGKRLYCDEHKAKGAEGRVSAIKALIRISNRVNERCAQCGAEFSRYPSQTKRFCSYQCHLDSGGAVRAGRAAGTMTRKYGARKDANHAEIVNAFKKLGAIVLDASNLGGGFPDLIVWCGAAWHLVDVKNPNTGYGRRGLNKRQKEWASEWKGGPVYLISTVEQVADMVGGNLGGLKRFPEVEAQSRPVHES